MVNWLPQVPETPQSGVSRGMAFFGNALDAVLDRRARMEQERLQREQQQAHALMVDARTREQMANTAEDQRLDRERMTAADAATAQHRAGELRLKQQEAMSAGIKEALPHFAAPGQETAGVAALQARGIRYTPWQPDPQLMQPAAPVTSQPDDPEGAWTGQDVAEPQRQAQLQDQISRNRGSGKLTMGEGGPEVAFDMKSLSPEGAYERNLGAIAAIMNPADAAVARQIAAMGRAGMVDQNKTGAMVQDVTLQRLNAADALERARIAATRRDTPSADATLRLKETQVTGFRAAKQDWEKQNKVDSLSDAFDRAKTTLARWETGKKTKNAPAAKAALYNTAREMVGPGVLTEKEFENTVTGSTGFLGLLQTKAEQFKTGNISDGEAAALEQYLKDAMSIMRRKAVDAVVNYDVNFGPGQHYRNEIPEEVEIGRKALLNRFGVSDLDIDARKNGTTPGKALAEKLLKKGQRK